MPLLATSIVKSCFKLIIVLLLLSCHITCSRASNTKQNAYIIQLSAASTATSNDLDVFHEYAAALNIDYVVRHEYHNKDVFLGLSILVSGNGTSTDVAVYLASVPNVMQVTKVIDFQLPNQHHIMSSMHSFLSYSQGSTMENNNVSVANLSSALQMGGVSKLHELGIKGQGIRIGIIDTGVDYRHPALGAGFGPDYRIVGGHAFCQDDGTLTNSSDPLTTCYGGGHGTHVTGILGMAYVNGSFPIVGVAPEASLYMYRVFDCNGHAASDTVLAAMAMAHEDGVDIVTMSLGIGATSFDGAIDPLAFITKSLTDAGVAVIVAQGNDATASSFNYELYTEEWPSSEMTALSVGAIANTHFPLIYSATDALAAIIEYAAVYPLDCPDGADVYVVDTPCAQDSWDQAIATVTNINSTVFVYENTDTCAVTAPGNWNLFAGSASIPAFVMVINRYSPTPYSIDYDIPHQGLFGTTQVLSLSAADGDLLLANYGLAGGYSKYKLNVEDTSFKSVPQNSGGLVDYYSSFGPTWHEYNLKPQLSAPGGHILSTWPLGPSGGYSILSGTSMATPYVAGCFALIKSQHPNDTVQQITERLQINSKPVPWIFDKTIISASPQQGAGLINCYDALYSQSTISPAQLIISDVSKTEYGTAAITIRNTSPSTRTYHLNHQGAGYMDYYVPLNQVNQLAWYGNATFELSKVMIPAGQSKTVSVSITPPIQVIPSALPVFGGFIKVAAYNESSESPSESFSIPYVGPPYSLYNTPHLLVRNDSNGNQLPQVYAYNSDGSKLTYGIDILNINTSWGFGGTIPTIQVTTAFRVDAVPPDTTLTADHYGYDRNMSLTYQYSKSPLTETIFGHASYGSLINNTGYLWPSGNSPFGNKATVQNNNGTLSFLGDGDYRWYASVLRWGGTPGVQEDYETWLGPVMRFNS